MSAQAKIAKLQGLLERIQRNAIQHNAIQHNAIQPRPAAPALAAVAGVAEPEPEPEEAEIATVQVAAVEVVEAEAADITEIDIEDFDDEEIVDITDDVDAQELITNRPPPPDGAGKPASISQALESASSKDQPMAPTAEQLGQTVELESGERSSEALELDTQHLESERAPEPEEHPEAVSLPGGTGGGVYDESLRAPSSAQADLDAHARRSSAGASPATPMGATSAISGDMAAAPEVVSRSPVDVTQPTLELVDSKRSIADKSFCELLDASVRLGG